VDDIEIKPDNTLPSRAEPNVAFRQTMTAVQTRYGQLETLIENHDFESVEYTARNAANIFLAGRAACRRLIERGKESSPYIDAARRLLEENYMALLELFARATKTIAVPRTRKVLQELRATLMSAMARPLSDL